MSVRLCPPSTAGVVCLRFVHANEPWRFHTRLRWLTSCPFPLALRGWWQHTFSPRCVCFRETRVLSFMLPQFLHIGVRVFQEGLRCSLALACMLSSYY